MYFTFNLRFCMPICSSNCEVWSILLKCQEVLPLEGLTPPDKITLPKKVRCVSSESEFNGNLEFFLNSATSQLCYLDHITLK